MAKEILIKLLMVLLDILTVGNSYWHRKYKDLEKTKERRKEVDPEEIL